MGLISATVGSISSGLGDQFKEYVTCPTVDSSVIVARGTVNHGNGNKNATEGVISNGSKIVVPSGWAMMIIDNGSIKEFTAEPGEFIWDSSSEPSVFEGGFFKGIGDSIKKIGSRITYGGQAARDQRVYYVNLLNITGNKFGSSNTEPIFDPVYGSIEVTFFGEYSFKVADPAVLVASIIGANAKDIITTEEVVGGQLKLQFASNVSTCISNIMTQKNVSFTTIQSYKNDVVAQMNELLDESWKKQYGLEIQDVALNINASDESKEYIREISREKTRGDLYATNGQALMAAATADAMKTAAGNDNGAMAGFMGMGMGQNFGGNAMNAAAGMASTPSSQFGNPMNNQEAPGTNSVPVKDAKFCSNCGSPVTGKFCGQCGTKVGE